jgi:butyrate kinase
LLGRVLVSPGLTSTKIAVGSGDRKLTHIRWLNAPEHATRRALDRLRLQTVANEVEEPRKEVRSD